MGVGVVSIAVADLGLEWVLVGVFVVSIAVADLGLEWVLVGAGTLRTSVSGTFLLPKGCSKPVLGVWGVGVVSVAVPRWRHSVLTAGRRGALCPERNGDSFLNARRFLGTVVDVWVSSLDTGYRQPASLRHSWVAGRRRIHHRNAQNVAGVVVGNILDC